MKKRIFIVGIFAVLVLCLAFLAGCAEKKAVVKEGDQTVSSQTAVKDTSKEDAERLAREKAEREARERAERERMESERRAAASKADNARDINFDFDKSNIRPDAREILKANAEIFLSGNNRIVIEGHCDERGTAEYNMALGERRAQETKKYLTNLGVSAAIMKTISYGEEHPIANGHDEEAWAKNRRASFVVTPQK